MSEHGIAWLSIGLSLTATALSLLSCYYARKARIFREEAERLRLDTRRLRGERP